MKTFHVRLSFDGHIIYNMEGIRARNKTEAYRKAKEKLAKQLFKMSKIRNQECLEYP